METALARLQTPVLVLSTNVGRGMYSLGEALVEHLEALGRLERDGDVLHRAVEDFLPARALDEDVRRYRFLSSRFPFLLNLPYRFPPIYARKLLRERSPVRTDLSALQRELRDKAVETVLCVSHRPAFWAGCALEREEDKKNGPALLGLLGEYGSNLGWRYIPWSRLNGFLSPIPRAALRFAIPAHVRVTEIDLPARAAFRALRAESAPQRAVLVVCGLWGQGRIDRVVRTLRAHPELSIHAVCGDNPRMRRTVERQFGHTDRVKCYGVVDSLAPLLAECASVITKPGIATLVEARAAGRKIFLLRGMPVAEDNNARFALRHFDAEWFRAVSFARWLKDGSDDGR